MFGVTAPIAKRLAAEIPPLALSSMLYIGAGIGLSILLRARRRGRPVEAPLLSADVPRLAAVTFFGGVAAPWLLVSGLARAPGVVGALALGLELPFTAILAVLIFGDALGAREWLGIGVVMAGGALLALPGAGSHGDPIAVAAIAGACLCWAIDSNLTQRLSGKDPVAVSRVKGLAAGVVSLLLSRAAGERIPESAGLVTEALATGFVGYGLSLVLYTRALRDLGTARTGAIFATAPFLGAIAALAIFVEAPPRVAWLAGALMAGGLAVLLGARHGHPHTHEGVEHEHLHVHDEHHRHAHAPGDPPGEPHTHFHAHEPLTHDHPHVPDLHHRHEH